MEITETEKFLKIYELIINEEHHYIKEHQTRVSFYTGIITAFIAGIIAGIFQASEWFHFLFLLVGPISIFFISIIAIKGVSRVYNRFLESITIRAKIEQELGLVNQRSKDKEYSYWQSEPIIPTRHIESRKKCESSESFIKNKKTKDYQWWTTCLFYIFLVISILMFIGLVHLTIYYFLSNIGLVSFICT